MKKNEKICELLLELEEVKLENDFLLKERDEMHNILCGYRKVNGELAEEVKELKNQIDYTDECMQILVEENNKLSSLEIFNSQLKTKEQHELEQATLLVDNLIEQLAQAEKEILTLSNDKKKLQLLNERMNNCITLQSQEIFKLLK